MLFLPLETQFATRWPPAVRVPKIPSNRVQRRQLAWKLGASGQYYGPVSKALSELGEDAIPAAWHMLRGANQQAQEAGARILCSLMGSKATPSLCEAAERIEARGQGVPRTLQYWLEWKADPEFMARRYFPRYQRADATKKRMYAGRLFRSKDPRIAKQFLQDVTNQALPLELRWSILHSFAASENSDVLRWLLSQRYPSRIQKMAPDSLWPGEDSDRDGLENSQDRNPYVKPRVLGDTERLLIAAAQTVLYGEKDQPTLAQADLPKGVDPFEIPLQGPSYVPTKFLSQGYRTWIRPDGELIYPMLSMEFAKPFRRGDQEAFLYVTYSRISLWCGTGAPEYTHHMKKIRGHWFCVGYGPERVLR